MRKHKLGFLTTMSVMTAPIVSLVSCGDTYVYVTPKKDVFNTKDQKSVFNEVTFKGISGSGTVVIPSLPEGLIIKFSVDGSDYLPSEPTNLSNGDVLDVYIDKDTSKLSQQDAAQIDSFYTKIIKAYSFVVFGLQ